MKVVTLPNGVFVENTYLVIDEQTGQGAVVDPGEDTDMIAVALRDAGVTIAAIWLTHAHLDHLLGVSRIREETGAPVYLHPADRPLYDAVPQQGAAFGIPAAPLAPPDRAFSHGDTLRVGDLSFEVRHVPGHSPGHVALVGHGAVFAGDVLFQGSVGRTDLPGGDYDTLLASIRRELLALPDSTIVYAGHGPQTTIGAERRTNPFLTGAVRAVS
jgi:hydroxyacylglutathione hydrolase